jgi:hypothetical protein
MGITEKLNFAKQRKPEAPCTREGATENLNIKN